MRTFLTALATAVFAAASAWIYRDLSRPAAVSAPAPAAPAPVPVVQIPQPAKSVATENEFEGRLEAGTEVEIRTSLSDYAVHLKADTGDFVQKGQLLVQLGDSKLAESVQNAETALRAVKAELQARASRSVQAEAQTADPLAPKRTTAILPTHPEEALAKMGAAKAADDLDRSRLIQAEAAVERAKAAVAETRIASPISGYVVQRLAEGELSRPDAVLLRIVDITTVKTAVQIGGENFSRIATNQEARVTVDSQPNRSFSGKVVGKGAAGSLRTRPASVSVEVANPEKLLKPGEYARVRLMFDQNNEPRIAAAPFWSKKPSTKGGQPDGNPVNPQADSELLASLKGLTLTMNSMAKDLETRENTLKITAEASQAYFTALDRLIARLRDEAKSSRRHLGLEKAADEIDDLPAVNVDEELLAFGVDISKALREMSEQRRALAQQNVVGDWALVEQTQRASITIKSQGLQRINSALADMRRKMIKRYHTEFLTTADRSASGPRKDRRRSRQ